MEIKNLKMINKGAIVCKFDIYFPPFGMTLREFLLMQSGEKKWISSPSRQYQDEAGKKKFYAFILFDEKTRDSFQKKCLELITPIMKETQPEQATYIQEECPF